MNSLKMSILFNTLVYDQITKRCLQTSEPPPTSPNRLEKQLTNQTFASSIKHGQAIFLHSLVASELLNNSYSLFKWRSLVLPCGEWQGRSLQTKYLCCTVSSQDHSWPDFQSLGVWLMLDGTRHKLSLYLSHTWTAFQHAFHFHHAPLILERHDPNIWIWACPVGAC